MHGVRAASVLGPLLLTACSFDSGGQGGSGAPQESTETSGAATASSLSTMTAGDTTANGTIGDDTTTATVEPTSVTLDGSTDDAATTTSSTTETGDEPPEFGPFMMPMPCGELNTEFYEDDPTLRADMLEIYFASLRPDTQLGENIWRATRLSVDVPFEDPVHADVLNSVAADGWPELSLDGLTLTFGSDRNLPGQYDLFVVERANVDVEFGAPTLAMDLSTPAPEAAAVFSATMLEVFLCAPLGPESDLQRATRLALGDDFGAATALASLNTVDRDCAPFLDPTGARVVFSSDRPGTAGNDDIWTAVRAGDGDSFEMAQNVMELNSDAQDDDPWWAPDGSAIWFSSSRGNDDLDIWFAARQ